MLYASSDFGESFILELVAIVIIVGIVWRYIAPVLRTKMNQRVETIGSQLAAGDAARAATEQLVAQRRSELETAREEAATIVEQARRSAQQLVADGRRRADEEHVRLASHASTQVDLEHHRMREELTMEMSSLVIAGAHRVVDAELDAPEHRRLIDESIVALEHEASV